MPKRVHLPDGRVVTFPDSMSLEDINQQAEQMTHSLGSPDLPPLPSGRREFMPPIPSPDELLLPHQNATKAVEEGFIKPAVTAGLPIAGFMAAGPWGGAAGGALSAALVKEKPLSEYGPADVGDIGINAALGGFVPGPLKLGEGRIANALWGAGTRAVQGGLINAGAETGHTLLHEQRLPTLAELKATVPGGMLAGGLLGAGEGALRAPMRPAPPPIPQVPPEVAPDRKSVV